MHLPRLIPSQRLSSVRSVELIWELEAFHSDSSLPVKRPYCDLPSFHTFLAAVPTIFSGVRSFYISVQGRLFPFGMGNERDEFTRKEILRPIENMIRTLGPQVHDCSIAVPSTFYVTLRDEARQNRQCIEQASFDGKLERHWRPLQSSESLSGYWVRLGQRDMHFADTIMDTRGGGNLVGMDQDAADQVFYRSKG